MSFHAIDVDATEFKNCALLPFQAVIVYSPYVPVHYVFFLRCILTLVTYEKFLGTQTFSTRRPPFPVHLFQ